MEPTQQQKVEKGINDLLTLAALMCDDDITQEDFATVVGTIGITVEQNKLSEIEQVRVLVEDPNFLSQIPGEKKREEYRDLARTLFQATDLYREQKFDDAVSTIDAFLDRQKQRLPDIVDDMNTALRSRGEEEIPYEAIERAFLHARNQQV